MPERINGPAGPGGSALPTLVVRGGTVVDQTGERRADVLITAGIVTTVEDGIDGPPGALVLDATGCELLV